MEEKESRSEGKVKGGMSRRNFIKTVGAGAAAATFIRVRAQGKTKEGPAEEENVPVRLRVNGEEYRLLVEPRWTLLFVLREKLGLTGPKPGCERGECGACTVLIDDKPRYSCMTLALEAEGKEITTIEGLMDGENPGPVQKAFMESDAFQCGYCTPGHVMAAEGLLRKNSDPTMEEIMTGDSGNLCRCGAYKNIFEAVSRAAEFRRKGGGK